VTGHKPSTARSDVMTRETTSFHTVFRSVRTRHETIDRGCRLLSALFVISTLCSPLDIVTWSPVSQSDHNSDSDSSSDQEDSVYCDLTIHVLYASRHRMKSSESSE